MDLGQSESTINEDMDNNDDCCNVCIVPGIHQRSQDTVNNRSNRRLCPIKPQILFLQRKILGCNESSTMSKPRINFIAHNDEKPWKFLSDRYWEYHSVHREQLKILQLKEEIYLMRSLADFKVVEPENEIYIETSDHLDDMLLDLRKSSELAISLEYHSLRSYAGFTWLMQISTECTNYFINALSLRSKLHVLNEIFMNPSVLKIFYNAKDDILRLQKDFCLFVVNMFDMKIMKDILMSSKLLDLQKEWLMNNMYFADENHTHFLLFLKTYLFDELSEFGEKDVLLRQMRELCTKVSRTTYYHEEHDISVKKQNDILETWEKQKIGEISPREMDAAKKLWEWRDEIARVEDESLNFILEDSEMIRMVKTLLATEDDNFKYVKEINNKTYEFKRSQIIRGARKLSEERVKLTEFCIKPEKQKTTNKETVTKTRKKVKFIKFEDFLAAREDLIQPPITSSKCHSTEELRPFYFQRVAYEKTLRQKNAIIFKPQLTFKDKVDNSCKIWKPRIAEKPNALEPLSVYIEEFEKKLRYHNPYKTELQNFKIPKNQLVKLSPIKSRQIGNTPLLVVKTVYDLQKMLRDLSNYNEIAIDIKYNTYRSYFGFTSLLQISTRDSDYVVDALALRSNLHVLNNIFTNPTVLKVFHRSTVTMLMLQKDLSLYVVNMFDVSRAATKLQMKNSSLDYLKKHLCGVNKHTDMCEDKDWRMRPLPGRISSSVRRDTHYLLFIKDNLSNEFRTQPYELKKFYNYCTDLCRDSYQIPMVKRENYELILQREGKKMYKGQLIRLKVIKDLNTWRNEVAQRRDENLSYILSNNKILRLAAKLPSTRQGVTEICNSYMNRKYTSKIYNIIRKAENLRVCRKGARKQWHDNYQAIAKDRYVYHELMQEQIIEDQGEEEAEDDNNNIPEVRGSMKFTMKTKKSRRKIDRKNGQTCLKNNKLSCDQNIDKSEGDEGMKKNYDRCEDSWF